MSIRPDHQKFALPPARGALELEAERLATLLADTERDLARLLAILDWMDGDADCEPEEGCEDDDAEPSLGAPERHPSSRGRARDCTCTQIPWAAGSDSDREVAVEAC